MRKKEEAVLKNLFSHHLLQVPLCLVHVFLASPSRGCSEGLHDMADKTDFKVIKY